jgi:hypothetical protein
VALNQEGSNLIVDSLVLPPPGSTASACNVLGLVLSSSDLTSAPFVTTWHENRLSQLISVQAFGEEARKSLFAAMEEIALTHLATRSVPPAPHSSQPFFGMPDANQLAQALDTSPAFDAMVSSVSEEAIKAMYGPLIAAISGDTSVQELGIDLSMFPPGVLSGLIQQLASGGMATGPTEEAAAGSLVSVGPGPSQEQARNDVDMGGPEEAALALNQLRQGQLS